MSSAMFGLNTVSLENARVVLLPIAYDSTSVRPALGQHSAIHNFMDAMAIIGSYDVESRVDLSHTKFHLMPSIDSAIGTAALFEQVYDIAKNKIKDHLLLTAVGGDPSMTIGFLKALENNPNLTVVHIDAYPDLLLEVDGNAFHPRSSMYEISKNKPVIHIGLRGGTRKEMMSVDRGMAYYAEHLLDGDFWMEEAVQKMTSDVYLSIDLIGLDATLASSTRAPEPGGLSYYQVIDLVRRIVKRKNIVGLDISGLQSKSDMVTAMTAARIYQKTLAYIIDSPTNGMKNEN